MNSLPVGSSRGRKGRVRLAVAVMACSTQLYRSTRALGQREDGVGQPGWFGRVGGGGHGQSPVRKIDGWCRVGCAVTRSPLLQEFSGLGLPHRHVVDGLAGLLMAAGGEVASIDGGETDVINESSDECFGARVVAGKGNRQPL
jgi:hypothetical protein